jgi:hypothetical protein
MEMKCGVEFDQVGEIFLIGYCRLILFSPKLVVTG